MNTKQQLQAQGKAPSAAHSDATSIEQQRAIAQVQGALIVAAQRPRNELEAFNRMRSACVSKQIADRAFFSFPRAGEAVNGASIHLATELARCWGNVDYGITELRRDDAKGESEMLAYAWDLETNTRITNSFLVPHSKHTRKGARKLEDPRDIYENNANAGARRLRECIFRIMPPAFKEEAQDMCRKTLAEGGGVPLHERIEKLIQAFAKIKVSKKQIEQRMECAVDRLTAQQVAQLGIVYKSINSGETTVGEQFEAAQDSADVTKALQDQAKQELPKEQAKIYYSLIDPSDGVVKENLSAAAFKSQLKKLMTGGPVEYIDELIEQNAFSMAQIDAEMPNYYEEIIAHAKTQKEG